MRKAMENHIISIFMMWFDKIFGGGVNMQKVQIYIKKH